MANKKINEAGLRVLELLKTLANKPLSPQELLDILEDKTDTVYRKEIVTKYLNTLKILGFAITKVKGKYCLQKSIDKIDFLKSDLSLILFLRKYVNSMNHQTFKDNVFEALQILEKSFSPATLEIINELSLKPYKPKKQILIKDENVKRYEKYCKENLKIEVAYKENSKDEEILYKISPLRVIYKQGKAVLVGYNYIENDFKEFVIDNIISSKQSPLKNAQNYLSNVTFKLKNRLAKSYVLKPGEKIIEYGKEYIIVSNSLEDRNLLIKRLIRYYDNCEILYPRECRQRMVKLIEEMENMYAQDRLE